MPRFVPNYAPKFGFRCSRCEALKVYGRLSNGFPNQERELRGEKRWHTKCASLPKPSARQARKEEQDDDEFAHSASELSDDMQ
jgi:hypothetical protein